MNAGGTNTQYRAVSKLSNFNKFTPQFSDLTTPPRSTEWISSLYLHKFQLGTNSSVNIFLHIIIIYSVRFQIKVRTIKGYNMGTKRILIITNNYFLIHE